MRRRRPVRKRPEQQRAKLFWTGRSQAVRLPKEFRIDQKDVRIYRNGKLVILAPDDDWHDFLAWAAKHPIDIPIPPRSKKHRWNPEQ